MKILFTGGGTGGHILPIIAVAREIRRVYQGKNLELFYYGPGDEFGSVFLSEEGIKAKTILSGKIRRYFTLTAFFQNLIDMLFKIPLGVIQSFFSVFFLAPDLIFSKGGYGSLPTVLTGWLLQVPIFMHESDVSPGLANKFLSRFASEIFISFPKESTEYFSPQKTISVGNPIRREILEGSRAEAKQMFKLSFTKPVILILGGSQGAQRINDKILEVLPDLLSDFEVMHQCGEKNFNQLKAEAKTIVRQNSEPFYHLFPFLKEEEVKQAYAASDLIISRAGSGSIFEIAALKKPSFLIPLPESAQNHQIKNAYAYAKNGAAIVIEETNFTPRFFLEKIKSLFADPEELEKMAEAASDFAKPNAARTIAEFLLGFLK